MPFRSFRYLFVPGDFYINGELDIVVKFAVDYLLEGAGFELSVPVRQAKLTRFCR